MPTKPTRKITADRSDERTSEMMARGDRIRTATLMLASMLDDVPPGEALTFVHIENAARATAHWLASGRRIHV
jgi:hypothetical protein